ncbi:divalent-cation tolerance protein CutA [uncultured Tateyamaria sp.]|uniref:divalent-cation tolerance protein CutA n=1 Tax=uncultured Tateyamaria sp. TaxID=455651 RepID=UPI00262411C8|nr:divalent-cation tolerance protein CutA [uncultured Tateyamaria sp.]
MHIIDIWVNCPSIDTADAITDALLDQHLIACANRYAPIQSAYVWDGAIQREQEHPLLLKTRADLAQQVEDAVRALHPYDVPPIIRIEATANADYLAWVHAVTRTT